MKPLYLIPALLGINLCTCWTPVEDNRVDPSLYNIGVGIADSTGPIAGVNMMGYANPAQINNGIHMRLYSRAFIFDDDIRRLVFVSVDAGMMGQLLKKKVVEKLQETYGNLYTFENVIISGTHTHSGPGGFLQHLLFDITSLGFIQQTFDAMEAGIFQSIVNAHNNIVAGRLYVSQGILVDASVNRSPAAYENNPEEEILQYEHNTDKIMTVLKMMDDAGSDLGMVSWYAVHPTSMNNTNKLVSGDNKGYAAQLFEKHMNPTSMPGQGNFVAAFAQSNCGDISPNTQGAMCQDTGLPCDILTSTCGGKVAKCYALGPGENMFESTKIIGEMQYTKAMELYNDVNATMLSGPIQFSEQLLDMPNYEVQLDDGTNVTLCKPALGYSFAAGTTDGPGAFDFAQGMTTSNPFWNMIVNRFAEPSQEQQDCHAPKPILFSTGEINWPYPWHPHVMDTQLGRIGELFIIAVPGEFTSMSGRRIKNKISSEAQALGIENLVSVIAGLSNVYSHYIATYEEYQIQRYEGASTIFGPHTLEAYLQQYGILLRAMANNETLTSTAQPEDLSDQVLTLLPPVFYDNSEYGYDFGDVIAQPYPLAYKGETVIAKFISGHPRNNLYQGETVLRVERQTNDSYWEIVATDASWETRFEWTRMSLLLGSSEATVYWDVPEDTENGLYRIRYYGSWKSLITDQSTSYKATTNTFRITDQSEESTTTPSPAFQNSSKYARKKSLFQWISNFFG